MEAENFSKLLEELVSDGKITFYYYCDETSSNPSLHHLAIPYPGELDPLELPYRWHAEKPDDGLIDPIWDSNTKRWIENNGKSQPALIARLQADSEQMQKKIKGYEQAKIQDAENSDKVAQALTGVQKGQAQTTAVLAQLVPMVQQLSKSVNASIADETSETKKEEGAE